MSRSFPSRLANCSSALGKCSVHFSLKDCRTRIQPLCTSKNGFYMITYVRQSQAYMYVIHFDLLQKSSTVPVLSAAIVCIVCYCLTIKTTPLLRFIGIKNVEAEIICPATARSATPAPLALQLMSVKLKMNNLVTQTTTVTNNLHTIPGPPIVPF